MRAEPLKSCRRRAAGRRDGALAVHRVPEGAQVLFTEQQTVGTGSLQVYLTPSQNGGARRVARR